MIFIQIKWIGRINALFTTLLGTCAGMSLLNMIFMSYSTEREEFLNFYAKFARNINIVFLILSNMVLFLGVSLALHYDVKSSEKVKNYDSNRHSYKS